MTQVPINPGSDGWQGPERHPVSSMDPLMNLLRQLDRRLAALERAAPGRASGMRMSETGVTFDKQLNATGATSIAGVSMNTFIPQQQAIRSEVIAARGVWPDLGTRVSEISAIAAAVQAEVTAARGGQASLNARLNNLASSSSVTSLQTQINTVTTNLSNLATFTQNGFNAITTYLGVLRNRILDLGGTDPGAPPSP